MRFACYHVLFQNRVLVPVWVPEGADEMRVVRVVAAVLGVLSLVRR